MANTATTVREGRPANGLRVLLTAAMTALSLPAWAEATLDCRTGPVKKAYGATQWLIYSCSDGKSVVVVSAGGPAAPFYFVFTPKPGGGYRLIGEGTGTKAATDAAHADLSKLTNADVQTLIRQTKSVPH